MGVPHPRFVALKSAICIVDEEAKGVTISRLVGQLAPDTGKIGRLLAIWNVRDFADHLRGSEGVSRDLALEAQDKLMGVIVSRVAAGSSESLRRKMHGFV